MEDFAINRRYNVVMMNNDTDFWGEYTEYYPPVIFAMAFCKVKVHHLVR